MESVRTFESAPGDSWRSRFDSTRNVIVVNNGHRDFVYAGRNKSLQLPYLVRLYRKELVLKNFVGLAPDQLLERMVELSLRLRKTFEQLDWSMSTFRDTDRVRISFAVGRSQLRCLCRLLQAGGLSELSYISDPFLS